MFEQFLLTLPAIFGEIFEGLFIIIVIGALAFPLGELLPRRNFDYTVFPYTIRKFEQGGRFYLKFKVQRWKDKVPNMSMYFKRSFHKKIVVFRDPYYIDMLIRETCVAEFVHFMLILISPIFLLFLEGTVGYVMMILYALGNIPFIMIQRYNRPRLVGILDNLTRLMESQQKNTAVQVCE